LWKDELGQDLVEYSLLLAFIAIATVALLNGVKGNINGIWTKLVSAFTSASAGS